MEGRVTRQQKIDLIGIGSVGFSMLATWIWYRNYKVSGNEFHLLLVCFESFITGFTAANYEYHHYHLRRLEALEKEVMEDLNKK
mgnify:FL=1